MTTAILDSEFASLHHLIGSDFEKYYLNSFPGADDLVVRDTLPWEMKSFGDLGSFSVVLRIALLEYINNHQDLLKSNKTLTLPNTTIKTFSMDLDGDGNLEWLIGAEYEKYSLQNWLLIKKQVDGRYHLLPGLDYDFAGVSNYASDIEVRDLTGDGNPEIIKIQHHYSAGGIHGGIDVYTWEAGKLILYKSIGLPGVPPVYGEVYGSEYVIDDFNKDGVVDIKVNLPRFGRFGCQWTQSSIYYLRSNPDIEVEGKNIPQTDECLIARALQSQNVVEQIQLYQRASQIFDPKVSPIDKLAWIRLQLAMAFATNGDDIRAKLQLDDLIGMKGEGKFLEFIKDKFVETNASSPLVFCDALYSSIASQVMPESIGSKIDIDLTHGAYPIDFSPVADLICPFPEILAARLDKLKIPESKSPINALMALNYSFIWTQSLNWDNDSKKEWLGVLKFNQPILVFMDSNRNWKMKTFKVDTLGVSKIEAATHTSANGSGINVLVLFSGVGKYCDSSKTVKWLIVVNPSTMDYDTQYLCDLNQYSLASESSVQYAMQEFSKPIPFESFKAPDWYYLPDKVEKYQERRTILNLVDEIENDVLNQTNWEQTASKISELIASLPKADSNTQIILDRLYYLRGLNYEFSSQEELAAAAYRDLTAFSPRSLWSQYAQIRVQPIKP